MESSLFEFRQAVCHGKRGEGSRDEVGQIDEIRSVHDHLWANAALGGIVEEEMSVVPFQVVCDSRVVIFGG